MKRKLTILALIFIMVVACSLAFTACSENEGSKVNSEEKYTIQTAYEQAKNLGFTGSLEEFTESIKGEDGKDGKDGEDGVGISSIELNSNGEIVVILTDNSKINLGKIKGNDGADGKPGEDGKDGVGVQSVVINAENHLIITLTNGSKLDIGNVKGADGKDGLSITDADIVNGVLKLTFSDGTSTEVGSVLGIGSITVNEQGEMVVKGTDGSVLYQGKIPTCVHTWSDWKLILAPTCTSLGYNTRTCETCGYVQYDFKEELGHTFGEWKDITNTCLSHIQMKICSVCGDTQLNEAQPNGHTWVQGECKICGQTELDNSDISLLNLYNGTYGYEYLGTMEKGEALQKLYMDIDKAVRDFHVKGQNAETNEFATLPFDDYGLTIDEVVSVWKTFKDDNPLYYWLSNTMQINEGKLGLLTEEEYKSGEARTACNKVVYDRIGEYTSLVGESDSDYRIALAYHDAIINAATYAYSSNGKPETAHWAHSIIGVFEEKGAVCEGYARTYQLLLNASGVENLFVTGIGNSELHAWNTIRLDDGNWYWCDLTWDDVPGYKWGINYQYFCATDTEFLKKHEINVSSGNGVEFLYDLPERSTEPFKDTSQTILNDKFTVNNIECTVVGFNTVELNSITGEGGVIIPETVSYNGVTYSVISLGKHVVSMTATDVFVPKTVKFIWDYALRLPNMKSITVDSNNKYFRSLDGVLYTKSLYTLIQFPSAKEVTSYTIPDETRYIADGAIDTCKHLQTLYVGKNVGLVGVANWGNGYLDGPVKGIIVINTISGEWNSIKNSLTGDRKIIIDAENPNYILDGTSLYDNYKSILYCILDDTITTHQVPESLFKIDTNKIFDTCTKLQSFTVEEGNEYFSVDAGVLYNKEMTKIVYVPKAIEGAVTIHDGVTSIEKSTFEDCTALTNITIPNSITSIGSFAFNKCEKLTSVTIPDGVTSIGRGVLWNCKSLTSVTIGKGVTSIEDFSFVNCTSLKSIILPDGILSIGESAFKDCTGLTDIVIGNGVTSIGSYAFGNCTSLKSVNLPNSVVSIGNNAFWKCTGLTNIVIPGSLKSISECMFDECIGLTNITIENGVKSIGESAFQYCNALTSVVIPDSVTSIGYRAFYACHGLTSVTISNNVKSIGNYAFYLCNKLTSVTIPDGVTSIGEYAFRDCHSLTSVIIPNSVTIIGDNAFGSCTSLTSVIIGNSVTSIGDAAFFNCRNLTSVYYFGTEAEWNKIPVGLYNESLSSATKYFYSATEPTASGNYWHYDTDGVTPVIWKKQ